MTVLVGYTFTPEGDAALEHAIAEARLRNTQLIVVHSRKTGEDHEAAEIVMYTERLEEIAQRLKAEGIDHTIHDFIRGNEPEEDIIGTAVDEAAEIIVIGLRARSKTGKYLFGSTAQDIILDAPCPVMSVKPQSSVPQGS